MRDHAILLNSASLQELVQEATGRQSCNVIVDLIGSAGWPDNLEVLATGGRIVVVGLVSGRRIELDLRTLMQKRGQIIGTVLRSRTLEEKVSLTASFRDRVMPLFEDGRVKPVIDTTFPLSEAAAAHRYMESNSNFGKIVLTVD